jgi:hypothetical protein
MVAYVLVIEGSTGECAGPHRREDIGPAGSRPNRGRPQRSDESPVRREETSPTESEQISYILDCRTGSTGTRSPTPPGPPAEPFSDDPVRFRAAERPCPVGAGLVVLLLPGTVKDAGRASYDPRMKALRTRLCLFRRPARGASSVAATSSGTSYRTCRPRRRAHSATGYPQHSSPRRVARRTAVWGTFRWRASSTRRSRCMVWGGAGAASRTKVSGRPSPRRAAPGRQRRPGPWSACPEVTPIVDQSRSLRMRS